MSGDLGGNPTPWPAPPAPGEQRLRSTTASPMQSPTLNSNAGGGTLQAALQQQQQPLPSSSSSASSPRPAAAAAAAAAPPSAAALSASSQQTILRGSSSSSVAAGANNGNGAAEVTSRLLDSSGERRFLGGVVGLPRERAHHLRVRKRVPLAPGLTAELGLGTELLSGEVTRHAALNYDVSGKWKKEERERQRGGGGGEMKREKEREKKTRSLTQNEKKKPAKKKKKKKKNISAQPRREAPPLPARLPRSPPGLALLHALPPSLVRLGLRQARRRRRRRRQASLQLRRRQRRAAEAPRGRGRRSARFREGARGSQGGAAVHGARPGRLRLLVREHGGEG